MKLHAQFFHPSALDSSQLIEACGDRGVIIYDARLSLHSVIADAKAECSKRGYKAFTLRHGTRFDNCRDVTGLIRIDEPEVVDVEDDV